MHFDEDIMIPFLLSASLVSLERLPDAGDAKVSDELNSKGSAWHLYTKRLQGYISSSRSEVEFLVSYFPP